MQKNISPLTALRFRDFRYLWMGLLASRIGAEMQVVAVSWQIYLLTNSPLSLGFIGLARFLPLIFVSLIGGILADIFDRRKLMLVAQFFMTVFSFLLALATFSNHISPNLVYFLIAGSSAALALDTPARQSIVPTLVPKKYFINAVSLNIMIWHTAVVLGPSLAGFLIAFWGVGNVYLIDTFAFLLVILGLLLISPQKKASPCEHRNGVPPDPCPYGVSSEQRS